MELLTVFSAIESLGHEVASAAFLEQAARIHLDSGPRCHLRIRVLDQAKAQAGAHFPYVVAHAVELDQPLFIARRSGTLTTAHFAAGGIPGYDCSPVRPAEVPT